MIVMLQNDIAQKRIILNTLMVRDKNNIFEVDTAYNLNDLKYLLSDTTSLSLNRSDVKAIDKSNTINQLKAKAEKTKLLPEFGVRYEHMFAFGKQPQQFSAMLMVNLPFMPWSAKMYKANANSYLLKNESLKWQKEMILNEATGMISGMTAEWSSMNKQYEITQNSIIPALRRNYETALITWQNNTGDIFVVLDAWEALNMAQMDALEKLQAILLTQVEIEKQLETK